MLKISSGLIGIAAVLSLATLPIPATAAIPPRPGVVNYVEGNANIDGRRISFKDVGSTALDTNQVLTTAQGKAEVLLTPGVFLRVNNNSQVRMVSTGLTDTSVELVRGEALVEADTLFKENHVAVLERGSTITLAKNGLYSFNADLARVAVYEGEATVQQDDHTVTVKKGKDVNVGGPLKAVSFDRNQVDDLYHWSNLRSEYVSEANVNSAPTYVMNPGLWYGSGWYWDPYFSFYSFFPGSGFLYSPFGWGFYSPWVAPVVLYRGGGRVLTAPVRGTFRGGAAVSSFRGGSAAVSGGFRSGFSGGGGFHGGGGGRR
jgi:hypothetical protein